MAIGFKNVRSDWANAPATFTTDTLEICGHPVMERWEDSYMKKLADIACSQGGVVLEVGFGLGISARHIQNNPIEKHIIIEANREVLRTAEQFSKIASYPIELQYGFWEDVVKKIPRESINGILFDTYPLTENEIHRNHFSFFNEAYRILKTNGVLTYYSDEIDTFSLEHLGRLEAAGFEKINSVICPVSPPKECRYWKSNTILAPIIMK